MSNIYVYTQSVNNICKDATCRWAQSAGDGVVSPSLMGWGLVPGVSSPSSHPQKNKKKFFFSSPKQILTTYLYISQRFQINPLHLKIPQFNLSLID